MRQFKDRMQAGRLLAQHLAPYSRRSDVVVLALPRGGVPVGFSLATAMQVALDVLIVRKLGVPGHEEYAMGALAEGGLCIMQHEVVERLRLSTSAVDAVVQRESVELERRQKQYRAERPPPALHDRIVILVDDGLATGSTMRAAIAAVRRQQPARIIVAVPVAAPDTCEELRAEVDEMLCLLAPYPFYSVSMWYEKFDQTSDDDVKQLLERPTHPAQEEFPGPDARGQGARKKWHFFPRGPG